MSNAIFQVKQILASSPKTDDFINRQLSSLENTQKLNQELVAQQLQTAATIVSSPKKMDTSQSTQASKEKNHNSMRKKTAKTSDSSNESENKIPEDDAIVNIRI